MKALIVLGGDAPGKPLLESWAQWCDFSIAADRGLEAFDAAGIAPDFLLGDMDSVSGDVLAHYEERLPLMRLNCQKDNTDGEAALDVAVERGAREIVFLGALGGRLDHALANLMLLVRAHKLGAYARIADEHVVIERVDGRLDLDGAKGDTVSLLPLGFANGVTIEGFFYPLVNGDLKNDNTLGVSNVVCADHAVVSVEEGDLLLFHHIS
ncbi:MAG: thiamine diphosphokinase [Clostridia bacterium]|nr:thiamine diphosphokinase [Clostridia bacterium]